MQNIMCASYSIMWLCICNIAHASSCSLFQHILQLQFASQHEVANSRGYHKIPLPPIIKFPSAMYNYVIKFRCVGVCMAFTKMPALAPLPQPGPKQNEIGKVIAL